MNGHIPTSRLVRVFIRSTFRDFIQERDELVKMVFPELRRRCKERFVEVLEVDLRWGITEEQSRGRRSGYVSNKLIGSLIVA